MQGLPSSHNKGCLLGLQVLFASQVEPTVQPSPSSQGAPRVGDTFADGIVIAADAHDAFTIVFAKEVPRSAVEPLHIERSATAFPLITIVTEVWVVPLAGHIRYFDVEALTALWIALVDGALVAILADDGDTRAHTRVTVP